MIRVIKMCAGPVYGYIKWHSCSGPSVTVIATVYLCSNWDVYLWLPDRRRRTHRRRRLGFRVCRACAEGVGCFAALRGRKGSSDVADAAIESVCRRLSTWADVSVAVYNTNSRTRKTGIFAIHFYKVHNRQLRDDLQNYFLSTYKEKFFWQ